MAAKKVDFRRLKEERESQRNKKKIDSPLAKYNSLGQLMCVLCNAPVKNEFLWNTHLQSKRHKENLTELKNKKHTKATQPVKKDDILLGYQKSNHFDKPAASTILEKRRKNQKQEDESGTSKKKIKVSSEKPSSLPSDFFDKASIQNDGCEGDEGEVQEDFFDKKDEGSSTTEKKLRIPSEEIPEGFFDDPKLDAKARKVEYKDPVEQEWEKFQKEIQMENQVSEALVEEDDEVARIDRQLYELNEQREYFLKANTLRDKQTIIKEQIEKTAKEQFIQDEDSTSTDSEDIEEFFDWRAKKAV